MNDFIEGLDRVLGIASDPRPLPTLAKAAELLDGEVYDVSHERIAKELDGETWADPLHRVLRVHLARWDYEQSASWINDTPPNSAERRQRIYHLLELDEGLRAALDHQVPFYAALDETLVIADKFEPWYTPERRSGSTFYWDAFSSYLESEMGWEPESVIELDRSTTSVVERISDPSREAIYQAKGLVVGHVQSGKTANITGVIAKAADAGYRLFIVLSGTMNLLRAQTQRRIDKELIGQELIRPQAASPGDEEVDYMLDADWERFVSHGGRPSERGGFDWTRLTGERYDYQRLKAGIESLNFECRDPSKAFFHEENLRLAKAKLMVVKKNAAVLRRVARDLAQVTGRLADVPALVIDDESDLASVNTHRPPSAQEERQRTAINRAIVELLGKLPRAQYVGYTATPFANVFVNPADAEDLFPKDFIVSLKRPRGYMGATDFHDLAGLPPESEEDPFLSNHRAFVRDVRGEDEDDSNLLRAIDSYVISGAIKLYREFNLPKEALRRRPFRHHTMLVHSSPRIAVQHEMRDKVVAALDRAAYEGGAGVRRLRRLFEEDFLPVSRSRAADSMPLPDTYQELQPFVGRMLSLLNEGEGPVLVVNGEPTNNDPDFDKQRIWKILVGGAKLSRGYTVEGLTVSYFRRTANAADTLMQMGRWFGFRELYQDLVRLFIGREEGGAGTYDIYEAFEGICRDEEAFREELRRYSTPTDGTDPITPMQVQPLVASHLEWVRPTARNKMFNATIRFKNLGGHWAAPTLAPTAEESGKRATNARLFRDWIEAASLDRVTLSQGADVFAAFVGIMGVQEAITILEQYQWAGDNRSAQRALEFLAGSGADDPEVNDWVFIAPQLATATEEDIWRAGSHDFTIKLRQRVGQRVGVYTESAHVRVAEKIISPEPSPGANLELENLRKPHRGVFLFYPVKHDLRRKRTDIPTMGFALLFPHNRISTPILFGVVDPDRPDVPVIDRPSAAIVR